MLGWSIIAECLSFGVEACEDVLGFLSEFQEFDGDASADRFGLFGEVDGRSRLRRCVRGVCRRRACRPW